MGSDHLPIIITCSTDIKPQISEDKTYVNFRKADWTTFTEITEKAFSTLTAPVNIYKAEKCFRKIIKKASGTCIPQGRIKEILPEIPSEAKEKIKLRNELSKTNPSADQIGILNHEIQDDIRIHKRNTWREKLSNLGAKTDAGKLFKLIKSINGQPPAKDNQGIKFKGKYITSASQLAIHFNIQYMSVVKHTSYKSSRKINKVSRKFSLVNPIKFSDEQTSEAIKKSKNSKAIGPDGMSNLHLKHLGPAGISYLTKMFNLSTAVSQIPQIWKNSTVIPLLKPGKPADESSSFQPVSLLCPTIKILERLILPTLQEHLEIPDHQHGFRAQHSTVCTKHPQP